MNRQRKFKTLLIDPKSQLTIIGFFLILALMTSGVFFAAINYTFNEFVREGIAIGLKSDHVYFSFLKSQKSTINIIFLTTSVISSLVLILGGLILSHRIAGPLSRMMTFLSKEKSNPEIKLLEFRKNDFFQNLASSFNEYQTQKQNTLDNNKKHKAS